MAAFSIPLLRAFYQGEVASGALIYVYQTGTTTPVTTYSNGAMSTPNAHPIVADSNGEVAFYVGSSVALRIDIKTSGGTLIRSVDPVYPAPNLTGLDAVPNELDYLSGVNPGTATATHAMVTDSQNAIAGLSSISSTDGLLSPFGSDGNIVLNPSFTINQRLLTSVADDAYAHDRWYALTSTGNVTIGTVTDAENSTPSMARLTQPDVTAKRIGYAQIIEGKNCRHLRGQQVTFRVNRFRCSASQAIRFAVLEWTGTEDAVTSDVVNDWTSSTYTAGQFFISSNLTVTNTTASTPGVATLTTGGAITVTLGSSFNNLIIFVWTEGTLAQNGTLDIGKVQLAPGTKLPPFHSRSYGKELALCQRYLPAFNPNNTAQPVATGQCTSTTAAGIAVPFPIPARIAPTGISVSNNAHFQITDPGGIGTALTNLTLTANSASQNSARLTAEVASGLAAGNATLFLAVNTSAQLLFTGAEL